VEEKSLSLGTVIILRPPHSRVKGSVHLDHA